MGRALVAVHAGAIRGFHRAQRSAETFKAYSQSREYRALLVEIRAAAVERIVNPSSRHAEEFLNAAAEALGVPIIDLHRLAEMPAHLVASGAWRPRAVNVRFLETNASSRPVPRGALQDALNDASKFLPSVKQFEVPLLYNFYVEAAQILPALDKAGCLVTKALDGASRIVRGWSDALASDVQTRLRQIRAASRGTKLRRQRLSHLPELDQRVVLMTAEVLSHMSLDIDALIKTLRERRRSTADLKERFAEWSSSSLSGLSGILHFLARFVEETTDEDAWRTFAIHWQTGPGIEKWLISTRGGPVFMLPTLEEALREGHAKVRVSIKVSPVDTLIASASISSRGGGWSLRCGPVGASVTNFEHEVKLNLPGVFGASLGEDYAYGPMLCLGYSPKLEALTSKLPVNVRSGGQLKVYHEALRPITAPTRHMAEGISVAGEMAQQVIQRSWSWLTGKEQTRRTRGTWPASEYWLLARRHVQRAAAVLAAGEARLVEVVRRASDSPKDLERHAMRAGLGQAEAAAFASTASRYLHGLLPALRKDIRYVEGMARRSSLGHGYDGRTLSAAIARLDDRAKAFEFSDLLLARVLGTPDARG